MGYSYQVLDDGTTQVLQNDGSYATIWPSDADIKLFEDKVWRWYPFAADNEARNGAPSAYTLATILGESGGDPDLRTADGGKGLMMLTSHALNQGLTDDEVMIPENNIRLGTDFIATNMRAVGYDVPKLASMYNAGGTHGPHPDPNAPWGYHEYQPAPGVYPYITRVVKVTNYAIDRIAKYKAGGGDVGTPSMSTVNKILLGVGTLALAAGAGVVLARGEVPFLVRR